MKKYLLALLIFSVFGGLGVLLYKAIAGYFITDITSVIFRSFLSLLFILATVKLAKPEGPFWKFHRFTREQLLLTSGIVLLFATNNYFYSRYGSNFDIVPQGPLFWVIMGFIVNSFFEEFAYRGFLQGYINQTQPNLKGPLSQGNLFASALMTLTHVGFFQVMDTFFAVTGLVCVLVFSLTMGYLRDKGCSIWFLIVVHTLVNFIYLFIHLNSHA